MPMEPIQGCELSFKNSANRNTLHTCRDMRTAHSAELMPAWHSMGLLRDTVCGFHIELTPRTLAYLTDRKRTILFCCGK